MKSASLLRLPAWSFLAALVLLSLSCAESGATVPGPAGSFASSAAVVAAVERLTARVAVSRASWSASR